MRSQFVWEGIEIALSYTQQGWHAPFDHIEIKAGEPLPITETGYKSHFLHPTELALFDSPEDFVRQWLENNKDSWDRQLSLF